MNKSNINNIYVIKNDFLSIDEKVELMREDAKFEISVSEREILRPESELGAIKDRIRSAARLPKVPKVFLSNDCLFNCAYCGCRGGNECKRKYTSTPRELAELSVKQAMDNGHGIFISSAIYKTPDYTEELIVETLRIIRNDLGYGGYVHAKVMPGTDPELIRRAGLYADRLSVNIEVANSEGYKMIAKNKTKANILTPMRDITRCIREAREHGSGFQSYNRSRDSFYATSQTTQLMAGSTDEDDRTILTLSDALYSKYRLSRVYYTAFHYRHDAAGYEQLEHKVTPTWRMHRLYQADRLMRLYNFAVDEVTPQGGEFLNEQLDPKAAWALRNLHLFPVEVNTAGYDMLIRIPGIGLTYARRILAARKYCTLTHEAMKSLGISMKRCSSFITCNGKYKGNKDFSPAALAPLLQETLPYPSNSIV